MYLQCCIKRQCPYNSLNDLSICLPQLFTNTYMKRCIRVIYRAESTTTVATVYTELDSFRLTRVPIPWYVGHAEPVFNIFQWRPSMPSVYAYRAVIVSGEWVWMQSISSIYLGYSFWNPDWDEPQSNHAHLGTSPKRGIHTNSYSQENAGNRRSIFHDKQ